MTTHPDKIVDATADTAHKLADRVAQKAEQTLAGARTLAADTAHDLQSGIDELREAVPSALSRAASQAEEMTRRSIERARQASSAVRDQVGRVEDQVVGYVKDEPLKAVMMAAAAGAAAAVLIGWAGRSRQTRR